MCQPGDTSYTEVERPLCLVLILAPNPKTSKLQKVTKMSRMSEQCLAVLQVVNSSAANPYKKVRLRVLSRLLLWTNTERELWARPMKEAARSQFILSYMLDIISTRQCVLAALWQGRSNTVQSVNRSWPQRRKTSQARGENQCRRSIFIIWGFVTNMFVPYVQSFDVFLSL